MFCKKEIFEDLDNFASHLLLILSINEASLVILLMTVQGLRTHLICSHFMNETHCVHFYFCQRALWQSTMLLGKCFVD